MEHEYNITPTSSLANTIICNYDTTTSNKNLNHDYLIRKYKKYEKTYRYKCIKIKNEYLKKIENLKTKINDINNLIIKEYIFYKKTKLSLKNIKFINTIFNNEYLNKIKNINQSENYFLENLIDNEVNKDIKNNNDMLFNNFIKSSYKINNCYLSNKYISKYSLWNINDINKSMLLYKKYFLNKEINKNKVFIHKLKEKNIILNNIELNINKLLDEIIEFRNNKLNFYRNNENNYYNEILDKLSNDDNENEIKLDKLDTFYFFDNEIIFNKIKIIKKLKLDKINVNNEIKLIKDIQSYYNSNKYNNLLNDIRFSSKYNILNNKEKTSEESIYIKIKKLMEEEENYKLQQVIIQLSSPLIIKNKLLFNIFNNKINKIFIKKLSNEINISQSKIKSYKNDIKLLEIDMSLYEDELNNIKMNRKLVMNYLFYKKKLLKLEKEILKQSNNCDFLI